MQELHEVQVECPYCGENVEIFLEDDLAGEMVQDCTVCCRPWRLRIRKQGGSLAVEVDRAQ